EAESAPTLTRLGQLQIEYLGEARAAVDSFRQALAADPQNRTSRETLEQLITVSGLELLAADVLEPLYRAEGNAGGLITLLQARATAATDIDTQLRALSDAVVLAEEQLGDA